MRIRLAKGSDYDAVMNLYNLFVGEDRYSDHGSDSYEKVLKSDSNFLYLAIDDEKMVGFVSFSTRNVVRYSRPIAELDELFVLERYRKQGVGRVLMEKAEKEAKSFGCYRIFIESHYDHKPAHKLYESLGYINYGYHFIKNL